MLIAGGFPMPAEAVFSATAATYDRDRWRLIPGAEQFYGCALHLIPTGVKHILELGAGSGLFTEMIVQTHPTAHIHLIDFSQPMLDLARKRLGDNPQLTFELADYLKSPLPSECDA